MHLFEATTADEVWLLAASEFSKSGAAEEQSSRAGGTQEILGAAFTIKNPRQRWIVSRYPAMNPAFALAEVVWILSGRRDSAFINYWNPKLPQFAGMGRNYHGAYGYRLRRSFGLDQLERAYQALLTNPDSRQVVLQIWDSDLDFPKPDGTPADPDVPCNVCSFVKIRRGRLEWCQILRSNDLFLGVPHNFVQFTSLQEVLAGWLGIEVGHYRHIADSLHMYTKDRKNLDCSPESHVENVDCLRFAKNDSDEFFREIAKRMSGMTGSSLTQAKLRHLSYSKALPTALRNWLLVLGADCARRNEWTSLSYEFMSACSNPALKQLWDRWMLRSRNFRRDEATSLHATSYFQPWLPLAHLPA